MEVPNFSSPVSEVQAATKSEFSPSLEAVTLVPTSTMNKAALTLIGIVINLTVLPANGAGEASIKLAAFPPTMRIAQEGPIEGAPAAQMAGARGGTESCQVVVTGSIPDRGFGACLCGQPVSVFTDHGTAWHWRFFGHDFSDPFLARRLAACQPAGFSLDDGFPRTCGCPCK